MSLPIVISSSASISPSSSASISSSSLLPSSLPIVSSSTSSSSSSSIPVTSTLPSLPSVPTSSLPSVSSSTLPSLPSSRHHRHHTTSTTTSTTKRNGIDGIDKTSVLIKLDKLCYNIDNDSSTTTSTPTTTKYIPSLSFIEFLRYNVSPNTAKEIEDLVYDIIHSNDTTITTNTNTNDITLKLLKQHSRLVRRGTYTSVAFHHNATVKYVSFKINVLNSDVNETIEQLESILLETSRMIISIDEITKPTILIPKKVIDIKNNDIIDENVINEMHDIECILLTAINDKKNNKFIPGFLDIDDRFYKLKFDIQSKTNVIFERISQCKHHAEIRKLCTSLLSSNDTNSIKSLISNFRQIEKLFISLKKDTNIIEYDPIVDQAFIIPTRPIVINDPKPIEDKTGITISDNDEKEQSSQSPDKEIIIMKETKPDDKKVITTIQTHKPDSQPTTLTTPAPSPSVAKPTTVDSKASPVVTATPAPVPAPSPSITTTATTPTITTTQASAPSPSVTKPTTIDAPTKPITAGTSNTNPSSQLTKVENSQLTSLDESKSKETEKAEFNTKLEAKGTENSKAEVNSLDITKADTKTSTIEEKQKK